MKNMLMYYYNFNEIAIIKHYNNTYIKENQNLYIFFKVQNINETVEIYNITKNMPGFYKFKINKLGDIFTPYNENTYVLLKIEKNNYHYIWFKRPPKIINQNQKSYLDRTNWYELWTKKTDYFEYQHMHINGKYKTIDESINYYIGMAENAISYISYIKGLNNQEENKTICHRRIGHDCWNPLSCVIDYKERELSEYLKYIFINNEYQNINIKTTIEEFDCTEYGLQCLMGRMLYPSFYFDICEKIINEREEESKLVPIIKRSKEYEEYVDKIFTIINKKSKIKNIDWL